MDDSAPKSALEAILEDIVRRVVREEIAVMKNGDTPTLLDPGELADKMKVPVSWVYEQSRLGKIPTHRLGKYLRFDLHEVLLSRKKNGRCS
jgi:hypothetical protein